jgi:hypothetical protein
MGALGFGLQAASTGLRLAPKQIKIVIDNHAAVELVVTALGFVLIDPCGS